MGGPTLVAVNDNDESGVTMRRFVNFFAFRAAQIREIQSRP
jgi:hypothetical protein